jgi:hypothetical protein
VEHPLFMKYKIPEICSSELLSALLSRFSSSEVLSEYVLDECLLFLYSLLATLQLLGSLIIFFASFQLL